MSRLLLRARRLADGQIGRLRRVPELVAIAVALLAVAVILVSTAPGARWADIFRGQAVNLVSGAVLGGFAYLLFVLRFRRAQLTDYRDRCRPKRERQPGPPAGLLPMSGAGTDPLVTTIVDELLAARPPRSCLVIGTVDTTRSDFLVEVTARLAGRSVVPVLVDLAREDKPASIPALVRDAFVTALVGTAGDARSGQRLFTALWKRRRIVAVIAGLDRVGQGKPLTDRREAVAALLTGSLSENIPFVACAPPAVAPSISEVAAFRARPFPRSALAGYVAARLGQRGVAGGPEVEAALQAAFTAAEPTRDPVLLDLAVDLITLRLGGGERAAAAVTELFDDPCSARRHLGWMCEWTLKCTPAEAGGAQSSAAMALAAIGTDAHYREALECALDDVSAGFDLQGRRRFAIGVSALTERGVVTVSAPSGSTLARFTHPGWFAFAGALGFKLEARWWGDLLRPGAPPATLDALTSALLLMGDDVRRDRSFLGALRRVGLQEGVDVSLEMTLAVVTALQADEAPLRLGPAENKAIETGWAASNESVRLRFVADVDYSRGPVLMDFLWSQVVPPGFDRNSFRVRKVVCGRLAGLGSPAFKRLCRRWADLLEDGRGRDLSSRARKDPDWRRCGSALASLGWVLPGLITASEERERGEAFA
ncbi:MAG: hypothetical protein LC792_17965, partial [Actinobacteria bacterium]|nr:hypothetical protein [Actinomycetota bacterium]